MKILNFINIYRRKLTNVLFIKADVKSEYKKINDIKEIKRILIIRPNHRLGNQLLITPLVQEVITLFPEAKIDLFLKGNIGSILFKNYVEIDTIIALPKKHFSDFFKYLGCWLDLRKQKYDLVINTVSNSSSGSIATKIAKSKYKVFGIHNNIEFKNQKDYLHIAKQPIYDFREEIKSMDLDFPKNKIPKINIKLDQDEIEMGKKKLDQIVTNTKKTICIFTFATNDKIYSKDWWHNFYSYLKDTFKNYNIIEILPFENVSQIDFNAPSFYSKDIREIAALIENTSLFIGADSGIMHLAHSTNTTTIGLFSVTNLNAYQPYYDKSFGIDTNNKSFNEIIGAIEKAI